MQDFTLNAYINILKSAQKVGYKTYTVNEWFQNNTHSPKNALVLRHDVDRKPKNALLMARAEKAIGVKSTYYFRIVKAAYDEDIIKEIASLGHEIGYHYEDFYAAKYNPDTALELFKQHLNRLRAIAPIQTIAMHGSPLSKFSNMEIWKTHSFSDFGVKDCILSYNWSEFIFFTDTGRTFGQTSANLRDSIQSKVREEVETSKDVISYLTNNSNDLIQLSTHPERWDTTYPTWLLQNAKDTTINMIKRGIRLAYGKKLRTGY